LLDTSDVGVLVMKNAISIFVLIVATLGLIAPAVPEPAPSVAGTTFVNGADLVASHDSNRAPVLLKFWATWCVACLQEMPAYIELHETYGNRVQFLAVNVAVSDPIARVVEVVERFGLQVPVAYDDTGELWDRFDVLGTPAYVLLDRSGNVAFRSYGHNEELLGALDNAVVSVRDDTGEPVDAELLDRASSGDSVLRDIDGNVVDLSADDDNVLVSYHFATWCTSYVKESYPELSGKCRNFDEQIRALEALPRVRLLAFATAYSTNKDGVVRFRDKRGIDYPVIFDAGNAYGSNYGTRSFPHLTVVAPGGEVIFSGDHVPANISELVTYAIRH